MKKKKICVIIFMIMCFIIFTYSICIALSINEYGKYNKMTKADAAIVLGAAVWGYEPSPVFKARIDHGIWLYKNGYVDKIIFTGGQGENEKVAESIAARNYAEDNLIQTNDILIETKSKITQENLYYAKKIAKDNGLNSFIIVSDPLHMKRAMLMAKDYGLKSYTSPTPTTRYKSWKSKGSFLLREVYYYIGYRVYRMFN
ncbi:YdcF family protein [Dethiothermospora halolimnae]|uniref:YdcF family protein n=1 Tax=Dethiothermospora halolimnae TaxID=3114390 RepID=UPI003CCC1221